MFTTDRARAAGFAAAFASALIQASIAEPVINEIMYRPGTGYPENTALEYIELHNPDTVTADVGGWALTSGVSFTIPAGTSIPAGGYLVIAANPSVLQAAFGSIGALGPWLAGASLSNNGEKITLSKPGAAAGTWTKVNDVSYATEGDWAQRVRESTWNGWDWTTPANGGGKSIEMRNPLLSNDNGQNWAASTAAAGGTPGAPNTALSTNIPPVIHSVKHSPAVPHSTESVTVSCEVNDEAAAASRTATLFRRNATTTNPGSFTSVVMTNDGTGKFSTVLPPAADKTIIEFYISSNDGVATRTWPAATSEGQNANCQYQVDNEVPTGADTCRLILTAAENSAFENVGSGSNRQFNMTLVRTRGTDDAIRYRSGMRIRGNSSRTYMFRPMRITVPDDDRLDGTTSFNLNPKNPWVQYVGMRLFQAAGLPATDAIPVELRRNGVEYTTSSGSTPDYGKWVLMEDFNADMVSRHWPNAAGGNLYKKGRPDEFWRSTQPAPSDPNAVLDGWSKQNNSAANDWSDLRNFFAVWQTAAQPHFSGGAGDVDSGSWRGTAFDADQIGVLETVADLNEWARWFAVMTIFQDNETNISNGQDDDYLAYFLPAAGGQQRLQLVPRDFDTILGRGDDASSHGLYDMTAESSVFKPLLPLIGNSPATGNADFRNRYFNAIRELYGTVFNADTTGNPNPPFYSFLDNHLTGWAPAAVITSIKTFATQRQTYLLGLIGAGATTPPAATATSTLTQTHGALIISEVLASNAAAHANGAAFPDVIELRNTGSTTIDLSGMSLSDDPAVKAKFPFPANTQLAAGQFLVVYADSGLPPGFHTGFQLDQGGDAVYLFDTLAKGQAVLDSVVFGPQATDFSLGRTGTDLNTWTIGTPSIGAANNSLTTLGAPGGLRINEWLGNPDYRFSDDFLEMYNPAPVPVPMGGMKLTDDVVTNPSQYVLPPLSFIGPGAFLTFKAKGKNATAGNPVELPFSINSTFGWLTLIGANGTVVDSVDVVSQSRDESTGRSPDGTGAYGTYSVPSPGLSNGPLPAPYAALLNGLRITEILYKPTDGNDYEFVELKNTGAAALDVSGVRFTNGIDYVFPAGTTLAPGAFTVIARNRAVFLTRFPAALSVLAPGQFTGALDNSGETLTLSLPNPWDVAILNFAYQTTWEPRTFLNGYSLTVAYPAVTAPRKWGDRDTWTVSSVVNGTPGADAPPSVSSALTVSGVLGEPFSYQITATGGATLFGAAGLPAGLSVTPGSGLISGSPAESGTFHVSLSAANTVATDTKTMVLTISTSGPPTHFTWDYTPPAAEAGVPFAAWITARDAKDRIVSSFNGTVPLSATATGAGPSPVLITEYTDENEDQFELQNLGSTPVNTSGWFVVLGNSSAIDSVNPVTWSLPASVAPGETLRVSELNTAGRLYFGSGISWTLALNRGWIMLFDSGTNLRDFAPWGWSAAELAGLSITVNGRTITTAGQWSGNGASVGTRGDGTSTTDSWQRRGTADTNSAADWRFATNATSWSATNAGLNIPWASPIPLTPASVPFSGGSFTGFLTVPDAAQSVRITATDGASNSGQSAAFNVAAAQTDTDGDGMPDAWESANGLNPVVNDSGGDADRDGQTNRNEYFAGTNPRSTASVFAISAWNANPQGQVTLSWPVNPNRLYRVSYAASLTNWSSVPGQIFAPAAAGIQTASFAPPPGASRAYYRVELITP